MKTFFALSMALVPLAAAAAIDPGEWEFTSVATSALLPEAQRVIFKRCIRPEDAQNPDRWMADTGQPDCKLTPGPKTADTYTWTMQCPHGNIRATGSARLLRSTMDGETSMTGEMQGQKFEIRTKVTGKRLGPCK